MGWLGRCRGGDRRRRGTGRGVKGQACRRGWRRGGLGNVCLHLSSSLMVCSRFGAEAERG
ncbi:hypothetical protein [Azospirillum palustre]